MQSETIGKLADALSKAQAEMKAPPKSKVMKIAGRGDYKYADLADVIEARRVGAKQGLAITQGMEMRDGYLALTTMLMHSSGEWKAWECPIPAGLKPQELGSYLTYMRRYSESGAWGLAAEDDDDGQRAHEHRAEEPAEVPPIVAKMYAAADEIGQHTGQDREATIRAASAFQKDGKTLSFSDPMKKLGSTKWLESTLGRLEKEAHRLRATKEPGAAEAAGAFTDGLETAPCCGGKHGPGVPCPKGAAA